MKHTPTIVSLALLGLCAGCSTSNRVPEGIVRQTNDHHHLQVRVGEQQFYAIYNTKEIRQGSTFSSKRISAVALTTNEDLADLLSIGVDEFPQSVELALSEGGNMEIENWGSQPTTIMVGDHKYVHRAKERIVAVLSNEGDTIRILPGQLDYEDFESKSTLSQALKLRLQRSASD